MNRKAEWLVFKQMAISKRYVTNWNNGIGCNNTFLPKMTELNKQINVQTILETQ